MAKEEQQAKFLKDEDRERCKRQKGGRGWAGIVGKKIQNNQTRESKHIISIGTQTDLMALRKLPTSELPCDVLLRHPDAVSAAAGLTKSPTSNSLADCQVTKS